MSRKRKEQEASRLKEQKKRLYRQIAIISVAAVVVIGGIVMAVVLSSPKEFHAHIELTANGDVVIPSSAVGDGLNYYDYGGPQDLLVFRDDNGMFRTAYDVCEECFSRGNAHYTLQNGLLKCQSCGRNTFPVASLGSASWGGCQPISIPIEYRKDTDSEIVIPAELLDYAADVFSSWQKKDYTTTLENYKPQ